MYTHSPTHITQTITYKEKNKNNIYKYFLYLHVCHYPPALPIHSAPSWWCVLNTVQYYRWYSHNGLGLPVALMLKATRTVVIFFLTPQVNISTGTHSGRTVRDREVS
jgi:hypothetical protein